MPNLPIKKIYVDSRYRTEDSISSTNFKIQLPFPITTEPDTVFFISDVCVPNVFRTIDADYNNRFYFAIGPKVSVRDPISLRDSFYYDYTFYIKNFPVW
jgi:hypothetical protein